jgi:hypothetical protein
LSLVKDNAQVGRGLDPTFASVSMSCLISLKRGWLGAAQRPIVATARQFGAAQAADKRLANAQGLLL